MDSSILIMHGHRFPGGQHGPFFPSFPDLLQAGPSQDRFHQQAAEAARNIFGREVFVRGVVEVSNFCRQNCVYCGMRRENKGLHRFRASIDQLLEVLLNHRPASITDINIQSGEDPVAVREVVLPLVRELKNSTGLGISVCLGSLPEETYDTLCEAGASIYILKFETGDANLYERLQCPGTFQQRLHNIRYLASTGWAVSSGFIAGLPGQTEAELMSNFTLAAELPLDGCSVSPFIPGDETPLSTMSGAPVDVTLNSMAALRLMRPDWVIPAVSALNLADAREGYRRGLRTGANLVTINLTPSDMRQDYLLYKRDRIIMTEEKILSAIQAENLRPSSRSLADFYQEQKRRTKKTELICPKHAD